MNTIKMYLAESGRIADLKKDFPLYQGQYQNKLLNVFVPTSILAPNFSVQQAGQTIADYVSSTAVKIGMRTIERNGKIQTSKTYYMRYLKTLTYQNIEYALYERKLPREFTFYAGQGQNAPILIANVVNINNETSPATILDITTSQSCSLDVLPSDYLDKDEPIEASELETLTAELNEVIEKLVDKQDKEDESLETNSKYVVGAINENKRRIDDNAESISANSQSISQNRNDIDELKESVISGETYIGVMQLSSLPSSSQLNQFVLQEKGRTQRVGDSIIVSVMTDNDTDKNYKYIYNGSEWSYYEIPALGLSENGSFGAIKGTYAIGDTNNLLVDISGGKIVDIYVKNGDGNYLSVRQYLNQNSQNIEDIISGDIMVGEAIRAIEDEMGRNINDTYLTKVLGATKQFVRDYAQPREISEIFFISESGYSLSIPTTPPDGVQFQSQTNAVGSFPFFQIEKINTASFELSHQNGYSNVLHISASRDCEVSFRLTTEYKLLGEDWQTLNVELSNKINFTAEDVQRIQLSSLFASLGDNIVSFTPDTRIRQTLEIVSQESGFTTFKLYSSEIYPSTFSLTTQNYILGSIDQAKSQIIMIGADGIIESNNAVFTVLNSTNYIEYKTNQREFLLNGNLPVVGGDVSSFPIRITFGDTTYNLYSFMKGGNTPLTLGDIASSTTYNTNTGYSFDIRVMFIETSDIVGFVLSPSTLTAEQITNIIGEDGSVMATIGSDGKVMLVLDNALQNKLMKALVTPMTAPSNFELVGIDSSNSQTMVELGDRFVVDVENDEINLSDETIKTLDFSESERLKTLNLFNPKNLNRITSLSSISTNVGDNLIQVSSDGNYGNTRVQYLALDLTNYVGKTLYFKCKYSTSSTNDTKVNFWLANSVNDFSTLITTTNTTTGSGDFNLSFVVPSDLSAGKYLLIMFYSSVSVIVEGYVNFTDIMLSTEDIPYIAYNGAIVNEKQIADVEHTEIIYDTTNNNVINGVAYRTGLIAGSYNIDVSKYRYLKLFVWGGYRGNVIFLDLQNLHENNYFATGVIGTGIHGGNINIQYLYATVNQTKTVLNINMWGFSQGSEQSDYDGRISKIEGVY